MSSALTDTQKELAHLARALKAPHLLAAAERLAPIARESNWSHEEYLAAVLSQEVSSREASGSLIRVKAAGFDGVKTLEDFNYDFQPAAPRDVIAHLATGAYLLEGRNIVLLGPPGTGKTHLATGLGLKPAAWDTVAFPLQQLPGSTGSQLVTGLARWLKTSRNCAATRC